MLPTKTAIPIGGVCKRWHEEVCGDSFWRQMLVRDIDFCGASPAVSLWASWKDTYKHIMLRLNVNTSGRSSANLVPFMATLGVYCPNFDRHATYARIAAFAGHLPLVERLIETASGQDIFEDPDLVR